MNSLRRPSPTFFRFAKSPQVFICLLDHKFYEFNKESQPQLAKLPDKHHLKKTSRVELSLKDLAGPADSGAAE